MSNGVKYVGWVVTAAALAIYVVMATITLPHLAALAGGQAVFDTRPLGYDFATAEAIIARLGADGAAYYENVQQRLDSAFPVLLCLTLMFWLIGAARRWQGQGLPLGSAALAAILLTAVLGGAAGLGENAAISSMLAAGAKGLTPGMVDAANRFTLAKTFFSTIAWFALLILALGPVATGLRGRHKR